MIVIVLDPNITFGDMKTIPTINATQFQLKVNQTFSLESDDVKVKFLNVTADSRCPSGVTCIWQGEAKILVNIIKNNQDHGNFSLTSRDGQQNLASQVFDGYSIEVVKVEPYPSSGKRISLSDYLVTFAISKPDILSPLKQFRSGVSLDEITCKHGFYYAIKLDHEPLCLKGGTISKLALRGLLYGTQQNSDTRYVTIVIPPGSENQASSNSYSPDIATILIGVNSTVRWINQADVANSIVSDMPVIQDGKNFGSYSSLGPGQSYEFTFTQDGTYNYHGAPHPWQKGTIIVIKLENTTLPTNELALKEGQREGPFLVEKIFSDSVSGLNFIEYPLATMNGIPKTLQIGDIVSNGCTESLTLVKIVNDTAFFIKKTDLNRPCPICLSDGTLIYTPDGQINVKNLKVGMRVWTQDENEHKQLAKIIETGKALVPPTHQMMHITLDDGRKLIASSAHPTTDNRFLGDLKVGDILDGAKIKSIEITTYNENYTFDILPSGSTGFYWANGILLKSTLK